jgi:phage tail protein X
MANRYPLIVDTSSGNQIKELPSGDNLNLTGNGLVGVTSLSVINSISSATVQTSGNATIGGSVAVTGSISTNANLNVTGVVRINDTNILELVDWDDLNNVPAFAEVALTGSYNDLNNKPVLATVATTGNYNDLNNKPVLSSSDIINALGYTPYDDFNPDGYISQLSLTGLTDTPNTYSGQAGKFLQINQLENGIQFSTTTFTLTSGDVVDALGYTPYNGSTNPNNYLTAEADTLDAITDRSNATTNSITVGGLTANGQVSGTSLRSTGNLSFDTIGTITVDTNAGGTLIIGGNSTLQIKSQNAISLYNSIIPDTTNVYDLGSSSRYFSNSYVQNTVYYGDLQGIPGKSNVTIGAAGSINITPGTATSRVSIFAGVFQLPGLTTTQRNALTPQLGDIIYNETTSQVQVYVGIASYVSFVPTAGWVNLYNPPAAP